MDSEHSSRAHESYDKATGLIFTLSTGALALSITFRSELTNDVKGYLWVLSFAWIFLAGSSLSYVLVKFFEAGMEMQLSASYTKFSIKRNQLNRTREAAQKMLDELDDRLSKEDYREQINVLCDEQLSALKKLKYDALKDAETANLFTKPIITLNILAFITFLLGILTFLAFGILANFVET
jgi:hypothetical protein